MFTLYLGLFKDLDGAAIVFMCSSQQVGSTATDIRVKITPQTCLSWLPGRITLHDTTRYIVDNLFRLAT